MRPTIELAHAMVRAGKAARKLERVRGQQEPGRILIETSDRVFHDTSRRTTSFTVTRPAPTRRSASRREPWPHFEISRGRYSTR